VPLAIPGIVLGASRLRTLADITAPLLRSAVNATWCFVFVAAANRLSGTRLQAHVNAPERAGGSRSKRP
ncbi:MAG: hypothetical protein K9G48_15235, partial [Reyranella sp.]|nr:hypothetical protein [Reyranella sp.]